MQTSFFGEILDLSAVVPQATGNFTPLPAGWYAAQIVDWETKPDKSRFLAAKLELQITQGQYVGRRVFENNFVMVHRESQQAHDIGQRKLRQLCDAVGADPSRLTSADPFMNREIMVKLSVQPGRDYNGKQYGPSNRIDAFKPYDGMPVDGASPAPQQYAAAPVQRAPMPVQRPAAPQQYAPVPPRPAYAAPAAPQRPAGSAPVVRATPAGGTPVRPPMPWEKKH